MHLKALAHAVFGWDLHAKLSLATGESIKEGMIASLLTHPHAPVKTIHQQDGRD
jgi:hypothetical protein